MVDLGTLIHQAKAVRCGEGNYPVLSMTMHDGLVFQNDKFKKTIASKDKSDYKVVKRNQLVISFPIDEGVLATQRIVDAGIVSPAYGIWDIDQEMILPEFLEYALRCDRALNYYKAKLRGSTARRRSLPTSTLLAYTVPLPDISEQEHILNVVHKTQKVISGRTEEISLLDNLIKARFVEMFGDSEFNTMQWPTKKLSELCAVSSSKRIYQNEQSTEGVPFLRISDLNERIDNVKNAPELFIPINKYNELKENGLVPTEGDILVTSRGTLGRCYIVRPEDEFYFQDGMISWLSDLNSQITSVYLSQLFAMSGIQKQIASLQAGSTVAYLSIAMLKKLNIMLPPLDLQEQFAAFVEQTDKSKVVVQKALDEAQTLFDSLMQKYFG